MVTFRPVELPVTERPSPGKLMLPTATWYWAVGSRALEQLPKREFAAAGGRTSAASRAATRAVNLRGGGVKSVIRIMMNSPNAAVPEMPGPVSAR